MPRPSPSRGSRLSAEERLLEQQRAELLRKQQELEKRLVRLPIAIEAQEKQKRAETKRRAEMAGPAISPDLRRAGSRRRGKARSLRMPSRERFFAKLKTLALLFMLVVIGFMLWRIIPSS